MPHEFLAVIVRRVLFVVEFKCRGLVIDGRRGRNYGLHAIHGVVKSRGINKRFEHRPRLTVRQRVIQLALPVIASSNYCFDLAGPRIKRHQRDLYLRNRLVATLLCRFLAPLLVFFSEEQIDVLHSCIHGGGRGPLQRGIERRVHAEVLA